MNSTFAAGAAALLLTTGLLTGPVAAQTSDASRQKDKNTMRNIGIGAGAAAAWEALHGKGTNALILGAGAAYAGKKYEDARKAQSKESGRRVGYHRVYQYRHGERVGYNLVNSSGQPVSTYKRVFDYTNDRWTDRYQLAQR